MSMKFDPTEISANDQMVIAIVVAASLMFAGALVMAMAWGVRDGQFENFQRSAEAIFDPDEPIGQTTDAFPGQEERRAS